MRTFAICWECTAQSADEGQASRHYVELDDSGIGHLTCPLGHRSAAVCQDLKFTVLFDSGALALIDGYTNEAVSSFAASLERFFEIFVRVVMRKWGIGESEIETAWKSVAAQSERQYGAFLFLHLADRGNAFNVDQRLVEFRNKVIHRGYIPRSDEVIRYAEKVRTTILDLWTGLQETARTELEAIHREQLMHAHRSLPPDVQRSTWTGMMMLRLDRTAESFEDALANLKALRRSMNRAVHTGR